MSPTPLGLRRTDGRAGPKRTAWDLRRGGAPGSVRDRWRVLEASKWCVSETGAGNSDSRSECGPLSTAVPDSREGAGREQGEACEAYQGLGNERGVS